jgi:DNA-binding CsgD family transcriptional regulator
VRVAVVHENEMFALGLQASLAEQFDVAIGLPAETSADVAVVSATAAATYRIPCPLVVCGELNGRIAPGNDVVAQLPRSSLSVSQLLACVHAASAGLRVSTGEEPRSPSRLDRRSLDVVGLLAAGAGTREIADELGYSERTIKGVIREVQLALGTRSRAQAVAEAMRQGLI